MIRSVPKILKYGSYNSSLVTEELLSTKERVLSKYEIEYVVEDGGVLYIDGIEYPAKAGRIIVAKPNRRRSCKFPFHCLFVHLSVEDEEIKRMLDNVPDVFIPLPQTNYKMAFSNIIRYGNKTGKNDEYAMISALFELLALLRKEVFVRTDSTEYLIKHEKTVADAAEYMAKNYMYNISLDTVAEHCHLSKIYFHNVFTKIMGRTPHEFLLLQRLQAAQHLLITSNLSIGTIAQRTGFSSQAYMTYVFKKSMGESPSQYKKQMSLKWLEG